MSTEKQQPPYVTMPTMEAARMAVDAASSLVSLDVTGAFAPETLGNIRAAIDKRRQSGFITDHTSRVEVGGLVSAALGDNDHMGAVPQVRSSLDAYAVGYLQADAASIELARSEAGRVVPITDTEL